MSLQRLLSPVVDVRRDEAVTAVLMFAYASLGMTAYNIVQPLTRSKVIASLGAVNVPWVVLGSGLVVGVLMLGYTRIVSLLPRRWALPLTHVGMALVMVVCWALFRTAGDWFAVAFYIWGLVLGILLISQFWTLAHAIYDPRQARRLFGLIGGGVMLGGMIGAGLTAAIIERGGAHTLLLWSAVALLGCAAIVSRVLGREGEAPPAAAVAGSQAGRVGLTRIVGLIRGSTQLQLIALIIALGAIGAALIDQQLNMAAEAFRGAGDEDAIGVFLAEVRFYLSAAALVLQIWVTPGIHRYLGLGFAMLILPASLAVTGAFILGYAILWAPAVASVLDRSLRYTVDKTSREVLFLPLPTELRQDVKPFVDVTVDRVSRGVGALIILALIQPWGLGLAWHQLSLVSLGVAVAWGGLTVLARREYLESFRRSLEHRVVQADALGVTAADLSTVETLVQELAHPDGDRVVYAIEVLESLNKPNLVSPLLLYHEAPRVRARALASLAAARSETARRWVPTIRRLLADVDPRVRAAAIAALGAISDEDTSSLARPLLADADARIRATAAAVLAASALPADVDVAEATLGRIISDTSEASRASRRDVAEVLRHVTDSRLRRLLIPLLTDPAPEVAEEAVESVRAAGAAEILFVPTLVSLLRHRRLEGSARAALAGYGSAIVDVLAHVLRDPDEALWVRRHLPATLALIPCQRTVDVLTTVLGDPDGFLRYKAVSALERLRRGDDEYTFPQGPIVTLALGEGRRYLSDLSLHHNLFGRTPLSDTPLLALALQQKMERTKDRIYRLLALIHPWRDVRAARWAMAHGDARARATAAEFLEHLLTGELRTRVMPVLEDLPVAEKVRLANTLLATHPRDAEETLLQLINDDDQVIAATAIDFVRSQGIWSLAPDIEHVLTHRDARDAYVFEAAAKALAERGTPADGRRALWLDPLPTVKAAGRLRRLPLFAAVSVDELFRVASAARQVRHDRGAVILHEGCVPTEIHLLIAGRVVASAREAVPAGRQQAGACGLAEALSGTPMPHTLRAGDHVVTLAIPVDQLQTLLSHSADLVSGLFATLADAGGGAADPVEHTGAGEEFERLAAGGVSPMEKVLVLQRVPLFSRVSANEMRQLAGIARTVPLEPGAALLTPSDAPALWVVLSGEVTLEDGMSAVPSRATARGGDVVGAVGTMAGRQLGLTGGAARAGLALRVDRDDLFALLGERPTLLRELFAGMFAPRPARLLETHP